MKTHYFVFTVKIAQYSLCPLKGGENKFKMSKVALIRILEINKQNKKKIK